MKPPGRAAGFALVWDPQETLGSDLADWVRRNGARNLWSLGSVNAYGLPGTLDFNAGEEPASWSESTGSAVWLGELYTDQAENAGILLTAAAEAQTGCDFQRLGGLFCIAFWSAERRELLLYRDASAARNLYWHQGQGRVAVATQLEILTGMPGVPDTVAAPGLHEYLRFLDVSPPNTIFQNIESIEPGQPRWLDSETPTYGAAAREVEPARGLPAKPRISPVVAFEAGVDALDEALHRAVGVRLQQDGPTGVFLSGGVDSSLLCAIAASISPEKVEAFTLGFEENHYDETPIATAVARHLGVRHHVVSYSLEEYANAFDGFLSAIDVPFADPAGLPTWLLYRKCRDRVDAVLDGTGADTLMGVMPARHARFATQYAARLPRRMRHVLAALVRHLPGLSTYAALFDFEAPEDLLIRWHGWKSREIEALCNESADLRKTRFYRIYRQFPANAHMDRYSALMGNLPDDRVHQATQATGLRVRFPYGDARVEDLVNSLPLPYRYTPEEPKRLLRALLTRYVPPPLWDHPKHGFDFPFVALMRHDDHALLRRYLTPTVLGRHGLLQPGVVEDYLGRFIQGDDSLGFRIWGLLILFGWLEGD